MAEYCLDCFNKYCVDKKLTENDVISLVLYSSKKRIFSSALHTE